MSCECKNLELLAETKRDRDESLDLELRTIFQKCLDCNTIYKSRIMTMYTNHTEDIRITYSKYAGNLTEDQIRAYIPELTGIVNDCEECKEKIKQ